MDEGGAASPIDRSYMNPVSPHLETLLPPTKGTVLLVDDNADMRRFIKKILMAADFKVETAANGEEALKRAISMPNLDVILTDVSFREKVFEWKTESGKWVYIQSNTIHYFSTMNRS